MKIALAVLAAVAASVLTSWLVVASHAPSDAPAPVVEPSPEIARLERAIDAMRASQEEMRRAVDEMHARGAKTASENRVPLGEIDAAVARALDARAKSDEANSRVATTVSSSEPKKDAAFDARAALVELTESGLSWQDAQARWKALVDAGHLDEMVALFERTAKERADDPKAQLDLGKAYLQKVFKAGGGPEAGVWATKADKSFDDALALDDHHWEARFQKAVSLSFWPPVFGKQTEAIKHFEILVAQQSMESPHPGFAQTHILLGNLYQQLGDKEKAISTWKTGLNLFPDNQDLAQQIANATGH